MDLVSDLLGDTWIRTSVVWKAAKLSNIGLDLDAPRVVADIHSVLRLGEGRESQGVTLDVRQVRSSRTDLVSDDSSEHPPFITRHILRYVAYRKATYDTTEVHRQRNSIGATVVRM